MPTGWVLIEASNRRIRAENYPISHGMFDRLREETRDSYEDLAALFVPRTIVPREDGTPELIYRGVVTTNFLDMMGARVMLGRGFTAEDARPRRFDPNLGIPPGNTAILTYEYWQEPIRRESFGDRPGDAHLRPARTEDRRRARAGIPVVLEHRAPATSSIRRFGLLANRWSSRRIRAPLFP